MATAVKTKVSIVDLSIESRTAAGLTVPDLHDITVPVSAPLALELFYDSLHAARGARLLVSLNGEDVAELVYDGENGRKQSRVDLTDKLTEGANDFRVRTVVCCHPLEAAADTALVWLSTGQSTVIRKEYTTRGSIEPFDQRWTLWFDGEV